MLLKCSKGSKVAYNEDANVDKVYHYRLLSQPTYECPIKSQFQFSWKRFAKD